MSKGKRVLERWEEGRYFYITCFTGTKMLGLLALMAQK
jgi:hypothetical protein